MALSKEDKKQFELKILAESLFKGRKKSYAKSFGPRFQNDRLGVEYTALKQSFVNNILPRDETIKVKYFLYLKFKLLLILTMIMFSFSSMQLLLLNMIDTVTNPVKGYLF